MTIVQPGHWLYEKPRVIQLDYWLILYLAGMQLKRVICDSKGSNIRLGQIAVKHIEQTRIGDFRFYSNLYLLAWWRPKMFYDNHGPADLQQLQQSERAIARLAGRCLLFNYCADVVWTFMKQCHYVVKLRRNFSVWSIDVYTVRLISRVSCAPCNNYNIHQHAHVLCIIWWPPEWRNTNTRAPACRAWII